MSDSPCPLGCGLSGLHSTLDCATRRGAPYEGDAGGSCARLRADLAALRVENEALGGRLVTEIGIANDAMVERDWAEALLEEERREHATTRTLLAGMEHGFGTMRALAEQREAERDALARSGVADWARGLNEGLARGDARAERAEARVGALWRALREIEERTRPDGDMADAAVNEVARAALAESKDG